MRLTLLSLTSVFLLAAVACNEQASSSSTAQAETPPEPAAEAEPATEEEPAESKPRATASAAAKPDTEQPEVAAKQPAPAPSPEATTQPKPAANKPAPAKKPQGPVVGETSQVAAAAQADPGYKCNEKYPTKFVTAGGSNVSYPTPKPKGGCSGDSAVVQVPFVPTAAGAGAVAGTLQYSICTAEKCVIKKKPMSVAFTAHAK